MIGLERADVAALAADDAALHVLARQREHADRGLGGLLRRDPLDRDRHDLAGALLAFLASPLLDLADLAIASRFASSTTWAIELVPGLARRHAGDLLELRPVLVGRLLELRAHVGELLVALLQLGARAPRRRSILAVSSASASAMRRSCRRELLATAPMSSSASRRIAAISSLRLGERALRCAVGLALGLEQELSARGPRCSCAFDGRDRLAVQESGDERRARARRCRSGQRPWLSSQTSSDDVCEKDRPGRVRSVRRCARGCGWSTPMPARRGARLRSIVGSGSGSRLAHRVGFVERGFRKCSSRVHDATAGTAHETRPGRPSPARRSRALARAAARATSGAYPRRTKQRREPVEGLRRLDAPRSRRARVTARSMGALLLVLGRLVGDLAPPARDRCPWRAGRS